MPTYKTTKTTNYFYEKDKYGDDLLHHTEEVTLVEDIPEPRKQPIRYNPPSSGNPDVHYQPEQYLRSTPAEVFNLDTVRARIARTSEVNSIVHF